MGPCLRTIPLNLLRVPPRERLSSSVLRQFTARKNGPPKLKSDNYGKFMHSIHYSNIHLRFPGLLPGFSQPDPENQHSYFSGLNLVRNSCLLIYPFGRFLYPSSDNNGPKNTLPKRRSACNGGSYLLKYGAVIRCRLCSNFGLRMV